VQTLLETGDYQVQCVHSIYAKQLLRVQLAPARLGVSQSLPAMGDTVPEVTQQRWLMGRVKSQATDWINRRQEHRTE
jgi:hypothetical protein